MMALAFGVNEEVGNDFEQAWFGAYFLRYWRHERKHVGSRLY